MANPGSGVTKGGKGDICPRAQHFGGAKLIITIYKTSNGIAKSHQDHQGSRRAIINQSDVSRRSFCRQAPACGCGLTHGCVTMLSECQGCELSDFPFCICVVMGQESSVHSACRVL